MEHGANHHLFMCVIIAFEHGQLSVVPYNLDHHCSFAKAITVLQTTMTDRRSNNNDLADTSTQVHHERYFC
jgi:hypothetical protein